MARLGEERKKERKGREEKATKGKSFCIPFRNPTEVVSERVSKLLAFL